ncbi:MAG: hypothetical protein ACOYOH_00280 [Paracraurococcus sp.]
MAEPYVRKDPGDIIRAQDWNEMQTLARGRIESHTHTGGEQAPQLTGAAIAPDAALGVKSVAATDSLSVKGRDVIAELDKLTAGVGASLPARGGTVTGLLTAQAGLRLPDVDLLLRGDTNHGLGWYGGTKLFAGQNLDGPALYGWTSGALGTTGGGQRVALSWDTRQNVAVRGELSVGGAISAGNSDVYFTKTDHDHSGKGNTAGFAAFENSRNYNALMILGRAGEALPNGTTGRYVRLWDYLQVEGDLKVTGLFNWGAGSVLSSDQGGSIELGGSNSLAGGGTPFIDFHYGSLRQDFNVRIINDSDGGLTVVGRMRITRQLGWNAVASFQSGWRNYGGGWAGAAFMMDSMGFVHLRGLVAAGSMGINQTIFVLPPGYRPELNYLHCITNGGEGAGRVDVYPDGRVVPVSGANGWLSLDGIVFLAV